jgi:PAS domain S-box-containing protein
MDVPTIGQTRLVILGATGMVGGFALRYALDQPTVGSVTAISRRTLGLSHPKLHEILHQDFGDCSALASALSDQDAAIFCLGAYTGAVPDAQLRAVTAGYVKEFARVLRASSPDAAFSFLSGSGADPTGRSRMAFARYKGEAENALLASAFSRLYILRPAYIYPVEPRKEPNLSYRILRRIYPVFRALFPNQVIRADDLAQVMVDLVVNRTGVAPSQIFENRDIRSMTTSLRSPKPDERKVEHKMSKQRGEALPVHVHQGEERQNGLEKANEDLRSAQAELQRRWQYLAEAQRLSHSGTFGWKVNSGELDWSDETYRILGFSRETNLTLDLVFDRIHPDDRERLRLLKSLATKDGMDLDDEHRLVMPDGVVKHVHVVAHAGFDSSGNREYIGVVTDITERKRAEEERQALSRDLRESNARLEEAQSVAHVGHWEWDLETGVVVWSDETYRIFGLKPQERPMDIATVRAIVHPDDRESLYGGVDVDLVAGVNPVAEFRIVLSSGDVRTVHAITSERGRGMSDDSEREAFGRPRKLFGTVQDVTERKRSDEERQSLSRKLEESNARLEEAQRVAHLGYWIWDLETNRVTFSNETCRIYGLKPQEDPIDLETIRELIHPEDREYVFENAERAVRDGVHIETEHRLIRANGEVRTVYSPGDSKRDPSGRPYQMFGTCQDITDRKRAEETLKQTQFYLREGQRLAHIGSWAFNDSSHYWSDELYAIYGLDPKSGPPTVEEYLALVLPQDRASTAENIRLMQEEHRGFDHIERIVRPDGQMRYVRCVAVSVVEHGVFKGFVGTTMDITEQELLTLELRREEAYLAEAQSLTHVGSWACNLVTRQIFHSSDENARLYGFDPSQGPIPFELFYNSILPEDEQTIRAKLENAIIAGADYDVEFRIRRTDGAIRFLRGIGHHSPSQEIGEYVGITMDITDRKHAAKERERLRQLEADLAHINRVNMMGELAAALAHEIKQPLAASITSANALLRWLAHDPPDLERARAAADRIEQDANRAADVINSLQSFYKTGTLPKRQIVDVKEIIAEMTVLLRGEADRHSITIHFEREGETPEIMADRVQLQQVFMNLMLNAIEAMKGAGGKLTIRLRSNPEGRLIVSISDTGIGLRTENDEQIFAPFHTTKSQGTGMGLTITRSIVESYGGRVWATNNQEAGATFHFSLPSKVEASA